MAIRQVPPPNAPGTLGPVGGPGMDYGALAQGAGQVVSGVLGNRARAGEAEKDRAFQERMRATQWQTTVADMEKAGINPAVAYSQGGAGTPGGAMAQQEEFLGPAISSAQQARRLNVELKLMKKQELAAYAKAKLDTNAATREAANVELIKKNQTSVDLDNELRSLGLFSARNQAAVEKTQFGMKGAFADRIRKMIFGGGSMVQPMGRR